MTLRGGRLTQGAAEYPRKFCIEYAKHMIDAQGFRSIRGALELLKTEKLSDMHSDASASGTTSRCGSPSRAGVR